ncbi:hypothetical protein IV02_28035 [Pseudomonas syringae]|uniref:Uncharacterized protein n=1 Tax=Pseudomonas syringae TaxID=317 RepID=A0A085UPC6_PSESX|nr:hypothetical protein IV02_28035 [Pseudomonas syringae]
MANLGVSGASAPAGRWYPDGIRAPLVKKCAILAASPAIDQLYAENYDECCAMLRGVTGYVEFAGFDGT